MLAMPALEAPIIPALLRSASAREATTSCKSNEPFADEADGDEEEAREKLH